MAQSYQGHESLSHSKRDCKSPAGFKSKRRGQAFLGQGRRHLGKVFRALARQKACQIIEGHLILTPIGV
jgi:putative transposase